MADWQRAFLSKVILDQETPAAVSAGITLDFFREDEYRRIYEFLLAHWNKHGIAADEDVVHTAFPTYKWTPQRQPLSYLIERMRQDRKLVLLVQGLNTAADFVSAEDPDSITEALQSALIQSRLETSVSSDLDYTQASVSVEDRLMARMEDPGVLRGITTGFDGINYVTGGFQPEQFIVLIGTPKSFKSATLLAMAKAVHEAAKVPLFIGFEMSNVEQTDRLLSLYSGVSLTKIVHGRLNGKEFKAVQKSLRAVEAMRPFVFSTDITSATTLSGVQAKVMEYQPDVVFVDGAYLMQSEVSGVEQGSPQALTSISRGLKRMAQSLKLPVVVTTQASLTRSKGGLSLISAMYTQAWGQDCDVFLGVERQKNENDDDSDDKGAARIKFRVIESRSGPRKDVLLDWDWHHGSVSEIDPSKVRESLDRKKHRARLYDNEDDD